jgi:hypothetical protein
MDYDDLLMDGDNDLLVGEELERWLEQCAFDAMTDGNYRAEESR